MKSPLCKVCLESDILCNVCDEKIKRGNFSKQELDTFRKLHELSKSIKVLNEIEIRRILGKDRLLIITRKGDAPKLIGRNGRVVKKLSNILKKNIKVMEENDDIKTFVQDIVYPVPVLGVNIVYGKNKIWIVRLSKDEENNLFVSPDIIVTACKSIFDKDVKVSLE